MSRSNKNKNIWQPKYSALRVGMVAAGVLVLPSTDLLAGGDGHGQYLARRDTIALGTGDASRSNAAIHTIDPWPRYSRNDKLHFNGPRMNLGFERYLANESIEPTGLATQNIVTGGGN